eukprot:1858012-Prymnesium_polylepis.1
MGMLGLRWADAAFPSAQDTEECAERSRSVAIRFLARARYVFWSCAGNISGSFESWGILGGSSWTFRSRPRDVLAPLARRALPEHRWPRQSLCGVRATPCWHILALARGGVGPAQADQGCRGFK